MKTIFFTALFITTFLSTNAFAYTFTCVTTQRNLKGLAFQASWIEGKSNLEIHEITSWHGQLTSDNGILKQTDRFLEEDVDGSLKIESADVTFTYAYSPSENQPTSGKITKLSSDLKTSTTDLTCYDGALKDLINPSR